MCVWVCVFHCTLTCVVTADRENCKHLCSYIWEHEHDVHYTAHVSISSSCLFASESMLLIHKEWNCHRKMQGHCLRSLYFEVCFEIILMSRVDTSDAFLRALEA